jgi:DNA-binding response OmpR family regulator
MRILIIEDEIEAQEFLTERLKEKGYAADIAATGTDGVYKARTNEYDLILLDHGLPEKNGFMVCNEIRQMGNNTPIIMMSVSDSVPYKVKGLGTGADDYISKPFYFDELYARMQAVMRRPTLLSSDQMSIDDLVLDTGKQVVTRGGLPIYLTRKEFSLLEFLLKHKTLVVTRGMIMEHIWDLGLDPFSNTIETHILNLRKKVENPVKLKLIHSVPGRGYKIDLAK